MAQHSSRTTLKRLTRKWKNATSTNSYSEYRIKKIAIQILKIVFLFPLLYVIYNTWDLFSFIDNESIRRDISARLIAFGISLFPAIYAFPLFIYFFFQSIGKTKLEGTTQAQEIEKSTSTFPTYIKLSREHFLKKKKNTLTLSYIVLLLVVSFVGFLFSPINPTFDISRWEWGIRTSLALTSNTVFLFLYCLLFSKSRIMMYLMVCAIVFSLFACRPIWWDSAYENIFFWGEKIWPPFWFTRPTPLLGLSNLLNIWPFVAVFIGIHIQAKRLKYSANTIKTTSADNTIDPKNLKHHLRPTKTQNSDLKWFSFIERFLHSEETKLGRTLRDSPPLSSWMTKLYLFSILLIILPFCLKVTWLSPDIHDDKGPRSIKEIFLILTLMSGTIGAIIVFISGIRMTSLEHIRISFSRVASSQGLYPLDSTSYLKSFIIRAAFCLTILTVPFIFSLIQSLFLQPQNLTLTSHHLLAMGCFLTSGLIGTLGIYWFEVSYSSNFFIKFITGVILFFITFLGIFGGYFYLWEIQFSQDISAISYCLIILVLYLVAITVNTISRHRKPALTLVRPIEKSQQNRDL